MIENKQTEKALLVVVSVGRERWPIEAIAHEFTHLVESSGITVVQTLLVNRKELTADLFIGKGKVQEICQLVIDLGVNVVIFNNELRVTQQRNLEDVLNVKTIDRTQLILDIFCRHARTQEGILQVELAQLQYLLPRLKGKGIDLSRLGGGIGTRGPGEKKLEIDRRRITDKIEHLTKELNNLIKQRDTMRKKREKEKVKICSLVGYTSAGKSTLFNALTKGSERTSTDLFTTLDTTSHTFEVHNLNIVLTDTVGFIYKLPTGLIEAFKATLEELSFAGVLVHVIDASSPDIERLIWSVHSILDDLKLASKKTILVFNKVDLLDETGITNLKKLFPQALCISALKGTNLEILKEKIYEALFSDMKEVVVKIPFKRMEIVNYLHKNCEVIKKNYVGDEAVYHIKIKLETLAYLKTLNLKIKELANTDKS